MWVLGVAAAVLLLRSAAAQTVEMKQVRRATPVRAGAVVPAPAPPRRGLEWTAHTLPQSPDFPVDPHSRVLSSYAVPVFLGAANKPYDVLGCIYVWEPDGRSKHPQLEAIRAAAALGKAHGADAIAVWNRRIDFRWYMAATAVKWR